MADHEKSVGATHPEDVTTKDKIRLPLWMWIVAGGIVLGGSIYVYKARKASAAQAAAAQQAPTLNPTPSQGAFDPTSILPMFQGQAVQNMSPPSSPTGPQLPTVDEGADMTKVIGNRWDQILPTEQYLSDFVRRVYQLSPTDTANESIDDSYVRMANPQINFSRPLQPGTAIFAPGIPK